MNVAVMAGNANSFLAMLCIGILFEVRFPAEEEPRHGGQVLWAVRMCALAAVVLWLWLPVPLDAFYAGGDAVCAEWRAAPDDHH